MPENEEKIEFENMDNDQILDQLHENPKDFVNLIASQVRKGIEAENEQKAQEDQYVKTFQDFASKYPDFEEKWEDGELKAYMDSHPGHNALSAYLNITHDARIKEAVQSKLAEKGLSDQSALGNTKKHGGTTRVLADRLKVLRSQGGGKKQPDK